MNKIIKLIKRHPIIPVYYNDDLQKCIEILTACYDGGIRVFEFVDRGRHAMENFKGLFAYKNENLPDLILGVGTIKNVEQAERFISAGAEFIVSPIINVSIANLCNENNIFWVPGCMTPSEIAVAEEYKAPLVKLFPGDLLGPQYLKSIRPLFPKVNFMPTGGVDVLKENIQDWFNAGVISVGLGSKLFQEPDDYDNYLWLSNRVSLILSWLK